MQKAGAVWPLERQAETRAAHVACVVVMRGDLRPDAHSAKDGGRAADTDEATRLAIGMKATFNVDAYPAAIFQRTVRQIRVSTIPCEVVLDTNNADQKLRGDDGERHLAATSLKPRSAIERHMREG